MESRKFQDLRAMYKDLEPSKRESFSSEEVNKLKEMAMKAKDMGPQERKIALDIARQKLSSNPLQRSNLDVDLKDFTSVVGGANPILEEPQLVKGSGGWLQDINKVKGQVPVDAASIVPSSESTAQKISGIVKGVTDKIKSPEMMKELSGNEFADKIASLKKLAGPGKKVLGAFGGPAVGLATALATGDASAALPDALQSEEVGAGSDTQMASEMDRPSEGGYMSPERRKRLFETLRNKY